MTETPLETVLDRLGVYGTFGGTFICPAHDDTRPSLSVSEGDDDRVLVYCHAGCTTREVLDALGLDFKDLFGDKERVEAAYYVYEDEAGDPLIRVTRFSPKSFTQERWEDGDWHHGLENTRRVPYRLPEMNMWTGDVWVVEGEKDADNLTAMGVCATTLLGGAGKWRPEYAQHFRGHSVILVGDNDDPGRRHVARLRRVLTDVATSIRVYFPSADSRDITDHLLRGHGLDELVEESLDLADLGPLDWENYQAARNEWLLPGFVPRGSRVLAYGAAGSLKSLWAIWLATRLSHEGSRVAYFSLEMRDSDLANRLKNARPDPANFVVFTRLGFNNEVQLDLVRRALRGYDLIVVDSWSAAHQGATNDEVARLDNEVFKPLIDETGATLLILDNTGHPIITDAGKIKQDHARGASAKADKMEVTLWFDRPYPSNNYRTTVTMMKMRLDEPLAEPVTIETPRDKIEFFYVDDNRLAGPAWPGLDVISDEPPKPSTPNDVGYVDDYEVQAELDTWQERFRMARLGKIVVDTGWEG